MARFFAVVMSHAPGFSGMPVSVHFSSAASHASCAISSASPTLRSIRASFAMIFADSMCHTASIVRSILSRFTASPQLFNSLKTRAELTYLDRCPLGRRTFSRQLDSFLTRCAGEQKEAADHFPGLCERPVTDDRFLAARGHAHPGSIVFQRLSHGEQATLLEIFTEAQHAVVDRMPLAL